MALSADQCAIASGAIGVLRKMVFVTRPLVLSGEKMMIKGRNNNVKFTTACVIPPRAISLAGPAKGPCIDRRLGPYRSRLSCWSTR